MACGGGQLTSLWLIYCRVCLLTRRISNAMRSWDALHSSACTLCPYEGLLARPGPGPHRCIAVSRGRARVAVARDPGGFVHGTPHGSEVRLFPMRYCGAEWGLIVRTRVRIRCHHHSVPSSCRAAAVQRRVASSDDKQTRVFVMLWVIHSWNLMARLLLSSCRYQCNNDPSSGCPFWSWFLRFNTA